MTTMTDTPVITKQDLARLRSCDKIVVRYDRDREISRLEVVKDADSTNPWEQVHWININVNTVCYEDGARIASAFALLYRYSWDVSTVSTFVSLLKEGDTIAARFVASNDNDLLRDAGLHHDEAYLLIVRPTLKKALCFQVDTAIMPNNPARMCKTEPSR